MAPEPAQILRLLLTPLGESKGLDYNFEYLAPSHSDAGRAFGFLYCGAELLLELGEPTGFPSTDRRTIKRGRKLLAKGLDSPQAREAVIFLAQAMALWLEVLYKRAAVLDAADNNRAYREVIQSEFPLSPAMLERLQLLRVEYAALETHEIPEDARILRHFASHNHALAAPGFDERLVEGQERYASRYVCSWANLGALELIIGQERYEQLMPKLMEPSSLGIERLRHQLRQLFWWSSIAASSWDKHSKRLSIGPPLGEPLKDGIAEYLRRRTEILLTEPPPSPTMSPEASECLDHYACERTSTEADWTCLTDAAGTGYLLRNAEEDVDYSVPFHPEYAALLRQDAAQAPAATIDGAATHMLPDLPNFFSRGDDSWEALRSWAQERALTYSRQRHALGMETGEPTQISADDCGKAFAYGYAIRTIETTLYGER